MRRIMKIMLIYNNTCSEDIDCMRYWEKMKNDLLQLKCETVEHLSSRLANFMSQLDFDKVTTECNQKVLKAQTGAVD